MTGKKFLIFGAVVLALGFSFQNLTFADTEINSEKLENIEMDCQSIKQTLKRVQNIDKNTRISIGRSYQTILTDFITPLNIRIVKNNQSNSELATLQGRFVEAREAFNRDYITYSQEFEELLNIDCKNEPENFYNKLVKTREKRAIVAASAKKVREIITEHQNEVEKYKNTFEVKQ